MQLSYIFREQFVRKRTTTAGALAVLLLCLLLIVAGGFTGSVAADHTEADEGSVSPDVGVLSDLLFDEESPGEPDYLNATFTYDPEKPEIRDEITFNASESSSPDGEIDEYRWDFTDNGTFEKTTSEPIANWTYSEIGNYTVTLEVEDTEARVNETTQPVRVDFAVDWTFETVDGDVGVVNSSPTIVDDTVYVGSNDGNLYALDQQTGKDVWRHSAGLIGGVGTSPIGSSPQVVDGTAYLLIRYDQTTYLAALDWDTGETLWKADTGTSAITLHSSPTVDNGTVYVGSRTDNSLYAFDAETGDEKWEFETGGNVQSSPTVVNDTVFVGSFDNNVYAVHVENGSQKWSVSTGERVWSSPTYADGVVYVGSYDTNLYAIDAESGTVAWSEPTGAQVRASPTVYNDTVYIASHDAVHLPGHDTNVTAFSTTGDVEWSVEVERNITSSPTVANDMVFLGIGSGDGNVTAFDTETGETQAKFQTGDSITSSPTVVDGILYVKSFDDFVYALDTGTTASSVDSRVKLGTLGHHENRSNDPPTVSLHVDPLQPVVNEETTIDASDSETLRGEIAEYRWDFTDDGTFEEEGSDPVTQWTFDEAGTHNVTVEIETTRGEVATRTVSVTVVDAPGLTEAWRYDANSSVRSSSTVVDGTVLFGSSDGNVTAVDEETGEKEWVFETGSVVRSTPTVVGGVVYVGSNDNHVYALDAETGDEQWTFEADSVVYSSPTVSGDTVYVGSHDGTQSRFPAQQYYNGTVFAINASSGDERWSFDTGDYVRSSPTVYNDTVYVTSQDNNLSAFDAATGELKWQEEGLEDIYSSPAVADGLVIVTADWGFTTADENVFAFDAASGEEVWEAEVASVDPDSVTSGGFLKSSPTVVGETVYLGGADRLYALDLQTGEHVWDTEIEGLVRSSPTVAGGTVYVGSDGNSSDEGFLTAIDAETGDSEWTLEVNGDVYASPTVVDGTIYVGSLDGTVRAIDTAGDESSVDSRVLRGTLGHHDQLDAVLRYAPNKPFATGAITFDGLDSGAPAGSIVEYRWDFTDDGTFDESSSDPTATWTYDDAGEQTVTLEVEDDDSNVATTTETIDIDDVPVATFSTTPAEPERGESVEFNASESSLPSDIVWYRWDFTGDGEFDESTFEPVTEHTYDEAGEYTVMLEVEDESALTWTTNQTVTVVEPVEMLVGDVTDGEDAPLEDATVEIVEQKGVGDPDPAEGGFNTTTTTDADGTFEAQVEEGVYKLTVDHQLYFPQVREDIEVGEEETKTVDTIALNPYPALLDGFVTDAETGNPIADVTVEAWHADLFAETTTNQSGWYIVGHDGGWLNIHYMADGYEDEMEGSGPGTKNVSLVPLADEPPRAAFEFDPDDPFVGEEVTFDAGASFVPGGHIEEYRWDFSGDGSFDETTSDPTITYSYDEADDYTVTLEVLDDDGETNQTSRTVTVEETDDEFFEVVDLAGPVQYSTPALTNSLVVVGGLDSNLTAIHQTNASTAWEFERTGSLSDSSPVIHDDVAYVGSGGGTLYALFTTNGSVAWTHETASAITSSPTVTILDGEPTVFVGANDGTVWALDAATGDVTWSEQLDAAVYSKPAVADGTVFVTTRDGELVALDAEDGDEEWRYDTGRELLKSSPVVDDGTVYLAADQVYAFEIDGDGTPLWTTAEFGGTATSTPVIDGDTLYVGSDDEYVYAVDRTTEAVDWQVGTDGPVEGSPTLVDDGVVVASLTGNVSVLDTDGTVLNSDVVDGEVRASPAVDESAVYIATDDGTLVVLTGFADVTGSSTETGDESQNETASTRADSSLVTELAEAEVPPSQGMSETLLAEDRRLFSASIGQTQLWEMVLRPWALTPTLGVSS